MRDIAERGLIAVATLFLTASAVFIWHFA